MPINVDANGRRSVEAEVEVPGTQEEVWQAIATGPGVSSWFVPTTIEEREGGTISSNFGPGMDSVATITGWSPPHRLTAASQDMGPGSPELATEWIVEARGGGTCLVRVVHSWYASTNDWDNGLEGIQQGWYAFFRILRLHLAHFRGLRCTPLQVMTVSAESTPVAWDSLTRALGLAAASEGERVRTSVGAPRLGGIVERTGPPEYPELLLRLDEPAPGAAHLFALPMGGQVFLLIRLYLYGAQARDVVAREEPLWRAWIAEHFASTAEANPSV